MTYEQIKPYIEQGLITEQSHPLNPDIKIFNYTHIAQFQKKWDEVTMACRGLIMNVATSEVVARPFKKFFNYGEQEIQTPDELPIVTSKLDGSLGILFWSNDEPQIATRGSFTSEQAIWATEWLRKNVDTDKLDKTKTYLFEIIYAANRIVVSYDFEGLVLLAVIDTKTGEELEILPDVYLKNGVLLRKTTVYPYTDISTLKDLQEKNAEGFVVRYPKSNLRLKIKFDEYVRLHKIMTGFSVKGIWESLRAGDDLATYLKGVPDEFYEWADRIATDLRYEHVFILEHVSEFVSVAKNLLKDKPRKEYAFWFKDWLAPKFHGIAFAMLDGKNPSDHIWKLLKPKNGSSTYKTDEE